MKYRKLTKAAGLLVCLNITTANASLTSLGNGLIYDNVSNIDIISNAGLFNTLAGGPNTSTSFQNLVSTIISDNNGVIAGHSLSAAYDFNAGLSWYGAGAFVNYLDQTNYDGYSDWRLPTTNPAVTGYASTNPAVTQSELGELVYNELGGQSFSALSSGNNANYNLFSNFTSGVYWTSTQDPNTAGNYLTFNTYSNFQGTVVETLQTGSAVIVRSVVPVPGAVWLFATGLFGLLGLKRRS